METGSNLSRCFGGGTMPRGRSGIETAAGTSATMPSRTNTERHPQKSMKKPAMLGPMAGANPMMTPTMPIALPYSLFG